MQKKYGNLFRTKDKSTVGVGDEKGSPVPNASSGAATPVQDIEENGADIKKS